MGSVVGFIQPSSTTCRQNCPYFILQVLAAMKDRKRDNHVQKGKHLVSWTINQTSPFNWARRTLSMRATIPGIPRRKSASSMFWLHITKERWCNSKHLQDPVMAENRVWKQKVFLLFPSWIFPNAHRCFSSAPPWEQEGNPPGSFTVYKRWCTILRL